MMEKPRRSAADKVRSFNRTASGFLELLEERARGHRRSIDYGVMAMLVMALALVVFAVGHWMAVELLVTVGAAIAFPSAVLSMILLARGGRRKK